MHNQTQAQANHAHPTDNEIIAISRKHFRLD